ncbi:hypothetical protein AVEN_106326-1 [Araneus ventricosus]|uniref:Uncharacterized protein n=1 Tax=Araneus ventricosus TaxID=182803 RepID=A0A4Y2AS45_ARAVE|nr:hypothetical protein AVEN_106326-1 [Araneus ventricosus]
MLNRDSSINSTWPHCSGIQLRCSRAQCNRALTCAGDKGTQTTGRRANSPPSCNLCDTVWRDMGLPTAAESFYWRFDPLVMVPQPMDDTTIHIQLSGNSRLSCTSLQHTDSPPTHLIVPIVSSTHAFRFGYLRFRGTIAACELKHRSGKPLFKALRCDRRIAFHDNFGCLFAFGDATSTLQNKSRKIYGFKLAAGLVVRNRKSYEVNP